MHQPIEFNEGGLSPSPNRGPLGDDYDFFLELANSAPDADIRSGCARLASCIEFFQRLESPFPKEFEQYGFDDKIRQITNEEIAQYLVLTLRPGNSPLRKLLHATFLPWVLLEKLQRNDGARRWGAPDFDIVLTFVCLAFRRAIEREYVSRRKQNEDANGRAVRQILVEERSRGDLMIELGKRITSLYGPLFFPAESPGEFEEAPSEACKTIWERISEYAVTDPVATNPKCLQAFVEGALNRIPGDARDHVRTRIETASRHAKIEIAEHALASQDSNQSGSVLAEMRGADRSAADLGFAKTLFEQFVSVLEPEDQKILELCRVQGHTQEEAGEILGMDQSHISKRLHGIRTSWGKFVRSSPSL